MHCYLCSIKYPIDGRRQSPENSRHSLFLLENLGRLQDFLRLCTLTRYAASVRRFMRAASCALDLNLAINIIVFVYY